MAARPALLVIDVQRDILALPAAARPAVGERFTAVRGRIGGLVERARTSGAPIVFVQHAGPPGHRLAAGTPGWELHPDLPRREDDVVVRKTACDAFHATTLQVELGRLGVSRLVVAGLMTQYCVDTTCRRAVGLGYDVILAADGHTTADTDLLTVEQIVAHHNALLDGFDAGAATIAVRPAADIGFA
ncbi:cysteine hydrolase family protein [Chelatococcus sp. SYSU_G07232]|uniref:Cysteine hydrolase family protein n=1 Tax=Chelatococcus albus TaxID=3047466 RepID=A0ABT7AME9_9HYPH|nr:cysteine hydrolase family protein [Chelatococcus sp. SYSU_G07232]MDJ1160132.1 cysteine hydrolase family protein [Chelatococcus sp. SYSU_G07232]